MKVDLRCVALSCLALPCLTFVSSSCLFSFPSVFFFFFLTSEGFLALGFGRRRIKADGRTPPWLISWFLLYIFWLFFWL